MLEVNITGANFETEVMKSEIPVLVDFWATWCGPCRMLAPVVKEIAEDYQGRLKVGKVNVDEEGALAAAFRIESIPTVALIKNGEVVNISVGYKQKTELCAMIDKIL